MHHRRNHTLWMITSLALSAAVACGPAADSSNGDDGSGDGDGSTDGDADGAREGEIECEERTPVAVGANVFVDISAASGIEAGNFVPSPPSPIAINDHSRIAVADINGDGCDDMLAHNLYPNWTQNQIPFTHLVFVSNCDGTFDDFSEASGLRDIQAGSFAFADVDNDGDQDCFAALDIPMVGETHTLLLNDGNGHFEPHVSGAEGNANNTVAANALFADFNNDGRLDLFLANGQTGYLAEDEFFLGFGDGNFSDVSDRLDGNTESQGNGAAACDYDNDGDQDIFVSVYGVSNAGGQNKLYENDGSANFTNVAVARGFASQATGNYWLGSTGNGTDAEPGAVAGEYIGSNGFGIHCGDIDGDGDMDIWQAAISHAVSTDYNRKWSDPTVLLLNQGEAGAYGFVNAFLDRGLPFNEGDIDAAIVDFDNDGRMDLSLTRTDKYEAGYDDDEQLGWFGLFRQESDGMFTSHVTTSGINDIAGNGALGRGGQNLAWSDIDLDGDLDLFIGGRDRGGGRANMLLRNDIGSENPWIALRLSGDGDNVNRDAIGARVTLRFSNGVTQTREVPTTRGTYTSSDTRTMYFGLGGNGCPFDIEVQWPDGTTTTVASTDSGTNKIVYLDSAIGLVE